MEPETDQFNQFDTTHDFRCESSVVQQYMICSTGRCGSHYLGHLMYSTGAMGYPLEYFHPKHFKRWAQLSGSAEPKAVIDYIRSRRTSPNGCFGFKAHFWQAQAMVHSIDFRGAFSNCRFISIERGDLLAQAISYVRAQQTGQWISMHKEQRSPTYDAEAIHSAILLLLEEKSSWTRFFAVSGGSPLIVTYEALMSDPAGTIDAVAKYLEVDPVQIRPERVLPKKQASAESEEWANRYLSEAGRLGPDFLFRKVDLLKTADRTTLARELLHRLWSR